MVNRLITTSSICLLAGYILLCILAAGCAEKLMFQPPPSTYHDDAECLKLTADDGAKITAMYLPNPAAKFTILYSHGNAEDLGHVQADLRRLRDLGFSVLGYDYHGYGTSQGQPSEQNAYQDINAAYAYLTETLHVPPGQIVLYGRSIGGGPSIDLASRKPVGGLITESAFISAYRVFAIGYLIPWDQFRNLDKIPGVHCPVLIIHGRRDGLVPFSHAEKLFAAANEPKRHFWVDNAGHNTVTYEAGSDYGHAILAFAKLLENTPSVSKP